MTKSLFDQIISELQLTSKDVPIYCKNIWKACETVKNGMKTRGKILKSHGFFSLMNPCPSGFSDGHAQSWCFALESRIHLAMITMKHTANCQSNSFPWRWWRGRTDLQSWTGRSLTALKVKHVIFCCICCSQYSRLAAMLFWRVAFVFWKQLLCSNGRAAVVVKM